MGTIISLVTFFFSLDFDGISIVVVLVNNVLCLFFLTLGSSIFFLVYSKLQSDALREAISTIKAQSTEKKRNFTETIELQIGLKNYDPQKDKRFSGSVKLPHIPRPKMKICMLGDAQHVEEVIKVRFYPTVLTSFFMK